MEFWTKKKKIVYLEEYLESLQEEVKAVKKTIADLKEEKQGSLLLLEGGQIGSSPHKCRS